jgi:hypothetical protein
MAAHVVKTAVEIIANLYKQSKLLSLRKAQNSQQNQCLVPALVFQRVEELRGHRRKIRLKKSNLTNVVIYFTKLPVKGLCGRCFICLRPPSLL